MTQQPTPPADDDDVHRYEMSLSLERAQYPQTIINSLLARIKADGERIKILERWQALCLETITELRTAYPPGATLDTDGPRMAREQIRRAEVAEAKYVLEAELIEWVANPGLYSKVYPQMCFFCGTQFPNEYETHADGCLHIRARALLREVAK